MNRRRLGLLVRIVLVLVALLCAPPQQTARAQGSPIIDFRTGDKEMDAAIDRARTTLPDFWRSFEKPGTGEEGFSLKVRIPTGQTGTTNAEHIWTDGIEMLPGGGLAGKLSNQPRDFPGKVGDRVEFTPQQISDWMFIRNGKMVGVETLRPMLRRMSKADAERLRVQLDKP